MVGELADAGERLDQAVVELERVRSGEADAFDARHARHMVDERGEIHPRAVGHRSRVGVDVLTEQCDLGDALGRELPHFLEHRVEGAAHFLAARIWHDAEAAVLAAALHDGHEGPRALGTRCRQAIELLDLREAHIDDRPAGAAQLIEHLRQAVQGLRAKHQVHERRALGDARAFLARHAAADADDHLRPARLQKPPFPEQREHFLLRLLAHRAGVHEEQVRLKRVVGGHEIRASVQHVRHPGGVVLIHLAAEGLDEVAAGHRACKSKFYLTVTFARAPHAFARARPKSRAQGRKLKYAQRLTRTGAGALERNVVVEIVAAPGTACGLLGLGRSAGARTGTPPTRAGTPTGRPAGARRAGRPTAPAPEHLQLVTDDLGRVAIVALLVLPFARAQASLDVDLRALAQVLAGDLCQAPEERHAVPFGALLLLTGLLVAPAFAGRDAQVRHGRAGGHGASLGVGPQVAYENDLVDATRHGESLKRGREIGFRVGRPPRRRSF